MGSAARVGWALFHVTRAFLWEVSSPDGKPSIADVQDFLVFGCSAIPSVLLHAGGRGMAAKTIYKAEYRRLIDALRERREAIGLSQTNLAKSLGWSQQSLSYVEAGARRLDVLEYLELTKALGYSKAEALELLPDPWS